MLPEDAYIIAFGCMGWIRDVKIMSLLCEVVATSPSKAIIKTNPSVSIEQLRRCFVAHNVTHGTVVYKLWGFDGKFIWQEHVQRTSDVCMSHVPLSIELSLQNASTKEYQRLVTALLRLYRPR